MFAYVVLILILLFLIWMYRKTTMSRRGYVLASFFVLMIFQCLRSEDNGIDLPMHIRYFENVEWGKRNRFGIGFHYFCCILRIFSDNPRIFIIACAILCNVGIIYAILKKSEQVEMSVLIYFFLNFYFMGFSLIRQSIAISMIMIAYIKYMDKKYIQALIFALLAISFHNTAIIALGAVMGYQIFKVFKGKWAKIGVIIAGFLCCYYALPKVIEYGSNIYYWYYKNTSWLEGNSFGAVLHMVMYLICLCYFFYCRYIYGEGEDEDGQFDRYIYMITCAVICCFAAMFYTVLERFSFYFSVMLILVLPNAYMLCKNHEWRYINIVQIGVYGLVVLYWLVIAVFRPEWYGAVPYQLCF